MNRKGGVGKTTCAMHIAYGLSEFHQKKVLMVDLERQSTDAFAKGFHNDQKDVFKLLEQRAHAKLDYENYLTNATYKEKKLENLYILPAYKDNSHLADNFIGRPNNIKFLAYHLKYITEKFPFDFIIIDTPPTKCTLLYMAIFAATEFIMVTDSAKFSLDEIASLKKTICEVKETSIEEVNYKILKNKNRPKYEMTNFSDKILASYESKLFKTRLPESTSVEKAQACLELVYTFHKNGNAARAFKDLVDEIMEQEHA
jgi:chromosome partitioning protein